MIIVSYVVHNLHLQILLCVGFSTVSELLVFCVVITVCS